MQWGGTADVERAPSRSWAALRVGRPVSQLRSLAGSSNSSASQLQTPFRHGVGLRYN